MINKLQGYYDAGLNYLNQGIQTKLYLIIVAMLVNTLATAGISYLVGRNQVAVPVIHHYDCLAPTPAQKKAAESFYKPLKYTTKSKRW